VILYKLEEVMPKISSSADKAISVKAGPLLINGVKVPVEVSTGPTCPLLVEIRDVACLCALCRMILKQKRLLQQQPLISY
jgi:hypothetical protein